MAYRVATLEFNGGDLWREQGLPLDIAPNVEITTGFPCFQVGGSLAFPSLKVDTLNTMYVWPQMFFAPLRRRRHNAHSARILQQTS